MASNSQTVDFRALLKMNSTQVDHPRSAPTCWLLGTIGAMAHEVTKGNQTNLFSFELLDLEPHPETEEGLLEKAYCLFSCVMCRRRFCMGLYLTGYKWVPNAASEETV